jgi:hypothetical protein
MAASEVLVVLATSCFSALLWWKMIPRLGVVNLIRGGAMFVASFLLL